MQCHFTHVSVDWGCLEAASYYCNKDMDKLNWLMKKAQEYLVRKLRILVLISLSPRVSNRTNVLKYVTENIQNVKAIFREHDYGQNSAIFLTI